MMTKQSLSKGWRWAKLGDVTQITMGKTPSRNASQYWNGNLPWATISDLNDSILIETKEKITELAVREERTRLFPKGTLLFSFKLTIGKMAIAGTDLYTNEAIAGIIPNNEKTLDKSFLWFALKFINPSEGSTHAVKGKTLNQKSLDALEIPLPPLEEQKRIAARLDEQMRHIEGARLAAEESLSAAWELPSAYLREVFEGKEAKKWDAKFIKDFAETGSGATPLRSRQDYYKNGNIPWVKTGELKDRFIDDAEEHVTEIAIKETSLRLFPASTLLIAMYGQGQTRGRTSIITKPMTTNQACFAILPSEHFTTEYLQMWFQYSYDRLRRETEGRGGNQPNLNGIVLRNQKVPLPNLDIQKQVVTKVKRELSEVRALANSLESQLAEIEALPSAVLGQAFGGNT